MVLRQIKNVYNAGELDENISARTDLAKYYNGCSKLINATVMPFGGIVKRGGTTFISETKRFSAWVTSTAYPVGCVVTQSSNYYYCLTAHTSGTFATDLTAAKWELVSVTTNGSKAKLVSFVFSVADSMILEFGVRYVRFYKSNARVFETTTKTVSSIALPSGSPVIITTTTSHGFTTGNTVKFAGVADTTELNGKEYVITYKDADEFYLDGTDGDDFTAGGNEGTISKVYEIVSPYDSTDNFEIHHTPSADVVYIAHGDYAPRKLVRTADTNWAISTINFDPSPFLSENVTTTTLSLSAPTAAAYDTTSTTYAIDNLCTYSNRIYKCNTAITAPAGAFDVDKWDWYPYNKAATTGLTLTAFAAVFDTSTVSEHIGSRWLLKHTRTDNTTSTEGAEIRIEGDYTVEAVTDMILWRKEGNGEWQKHKTFKGAQIYESNEEEESTFYKFTGGSGTRSITADNQVNYGIVEITAVTSSTVATVKVIDDVYFYDATDVTAGYDNATTMWAEGAWSEYRGYPKTVTFHEDRLIWAGSLYKPQTLWGSRSGVYENHTIGVADDDSFIFTLNDNDISAIQWITSSGRGLVVGTANKEYLLTNVNPNEPLTPEAGKTKSVIQSSHGSHTIQPVMLNDSLFYAQGQGKKFRVMDYNYEKEKMKSLDATMLGNNLFNSLPVDMACQRIPDAILWIVRADGVLLSLSYEPDEMVLGWARHIFGNVGKYSETPTAYVESIAVIRGSVEDDVWLSIKRTINGSTVRYIEKMSTRFFDKPDQCLMLDSAVTRTSTSNSSDVVVATDTVRFGSGGFGSGTFGGV